MQGRYGKWHREQQKRQDRAILSRLVNALDSGGTEVGKAYRQGLTGSRRRNRAYRGVVPMELWHESQNWGLDIPSADRYDVQ